LRRAQITLMLATLVPTVLMIGLGILLLAIGSGSAAIVIGVLVLAFCTSSLTGYILGSIFVSRGASLARVQNDFVSAVSHELRTPLTSIRMFIDTLRDERLTDPDAKRQCLGLLSQEVQRLQGLVTRVIELSRIETGHHAFQRKPVSIADVVDDATQALRAASLGDPEPLHVDVDVPADLRVLGDRGALGQALSNLLINSWKYAAAPERRISVSARERVRRQVEIIVVDNGPGIPRNEQALIFEKFERGQSAVNSRKTGSGLGLAIVSAIVRAHGGKIELHSRPGHGAEFRIKLRAIDGRRDAEVA
jgi:two-component system phosphate regulon sensor histidine kinase PhoR